MGHLKVFTEQQVAKSESAQATMPSGINKLPEGTRLTVMMDENGVPKTAEWKNGEVVVMCRKTPKGIAMVSAAMMKKVPGIIEEGGLAVPEGKDLVVSHERLALADKA